MVLTFVNKYFMAGTIIELLKLKPKFAFADGRKLGEAIHQPIFLASRCYCSSTIKKWAKLIVFIPEDTAFSILLGTTIRFTRGCQKA